MIAVGINYVNYEFTFTPIYSTSQMYFAHFVYKFEDEKFIIIKSVIKGLIDTTDFYEFLQAIEKFYSTTRSTNINKYEFRV